MNIFWVPVESRWSYLQGRAKQPTIGKAEATGDLALQAFGQTEILAALTPDQVKATRAKIAVKFPGPPSQLTSVQRFRCSWTGKCGLAAHFGMALQILLSQEKQIHTLPAERGQKLIIRPTAPLSWVQIMMRFRNFAWKLSSC
jgi:hypothetical protein